MSDALKNVLLCLLLCLLLFLLMLLPFYYGVRHNKDQVRSRAIEIIDRDLDECYSNQDIEIIIFGEIQE